MSGEGPAGAKCYCVDGENGEHVDAPSEGALSMLISDQHGSDNTFVVVQPGQDEPAWFASVAVVDEGGYESVRGDTAEGVAFPRAG